MRGEKVTKKKCGSKCSGSDAGRGRCQSHVRP